MTGIELCEVLWNVQRLEKRGIFLKDFDPMDVEAVYQFGVVIDNYIAMEKRLKQEHNDTKTENPSLH